MDALRNFEIQEAEQFLKVVDESEFEPAEVVADRFKIRDIEGANWALRKIAAYKAKQEEIDELAEAERFRINQWRERETQSIQSGIAYFEGLLAQFLLERRRIEPTYKISTPYGKVTTRKRQPKWEYNDEELLAFLEETGMEEFIKIKKEVNKADLKKAVIIEDEAALIAGVTLPGIRVTEQPEKVVVEVK